MQIAANSMLSATLGRAMTDMRSTFDDLTRQLSSGKVSDTYGGLGTGRSTSLAMRAKLSQFTGYQNTITTVNTRLSLVSTNLTHVADLGSEQRSDTDPSVSTVIANGQTRAQVDARSRLDEALSVLGADFAGSYVFGGRATDHNPVESSAKILDGDGTKVGLRAVITERRAADLGTVGPDGLGNDQVGRLTVGANSGSSFNIAEDGVHSFGFKLSGGASTVAGATVSTPSGSPPSLDIGMTQQASDGQTFRLTVTLPDGTTDDLTMTASSSAIATDGSQFQIGATVSDTLDSLRSAILTQLGTESRTTLAAASSVVAAQGFFAAGPNTPPKRVDLTPPATLATATSLRDATPTDTVVWYTGDDDPNVTARNSSTAQVDNGITVSFGVRANEEGVAKVVRTLALYAAEVYPPGDADAAKRNSALSDRVRSALEPKTDAGTITAISAELATAQDSATAAKSRLDVASNTAQDLIDSVEKADDQTVAASIMTVQTRLQASYQTSALLAKMSLVNYMG